MNNNYNYQRQRLQYACTFPHINQKVAYSHKIIICKSSTHDAIFAQLNWVKYMNASFANQTFSLATSSLATNGN